MDRVIRVTQNEHLKNLFQRIATGNMPTEDELRAFNMNQPNQNAPPY